MQYCSVNSHFLSLLQFGLEILCKQIKGNIQNEMYNTIKRHSLAVI